MRWLSKWSWLPMSGAASMVVAIFFLGLAYSKPSTADWPSIRVGKIKRKLFWTFSSPIIFIGDSITELAPIPAKLCNRPTINAGIGGLDTASYAATMNQIGDLSGGTIIVALGSNDASIGHPDSFAQDYLALVRNLEPRTGKLLLAGLPPIEATHEFSGRFDQARADRIDSQIRAIADETGHPFIDLKSAMASEGSVTTDGVHLSQTGYKPWLHAMYRALGCGT